MLVAQIRVQKLRNRFTASCIQNQVPVLRSVSCNVSEGPNGLLNDIQVLASKHADKNVKRSLLEKNLTVLVVARSDVCNTPGSLELKSGLVLSLDELDKFGDEVCVDRLLQRGLLLERKKSAETDRCEGLQERVCRVNEFEQL